MGNVGDGGRVMEWQAVKLKDCSEIFPGYAFDSASFTENENDIPLVKGENLHQGYIDWNAAKKWPIHDWSKLERFQLKSNDIVLAMDRPWIEAGLKWSWMKPGYPKALLVQRVARIRANKDVDQAFLRYIIGSGMFEGYVKPIVTGVNVPHISGGQIGNFMFLRPPIPVQRKIAAVISAYDDLIENNNRRIAILEKMAEELYREWFVRLRFPGHEKTKLHKGVPEGWEQNRIGDILSFKYGFTESAIEDRQYPKFLRVMDINKASYIKWSEVPNCKIDENEKEKYLLKKSDLIIARMASPGKIAIIERDIDAVFASYLIKMTLNTNNILPYYAFYTLTNDYYQGMFSNADTSATRGNINGQIISRFQIIIPPFELQQLFEKQILSIRNALNNFVIRNETLTISRDLLLFRLITGKLSVEDLDIQFPPCMKEEEVSA